MYVWYDSDSVWIVECVYVINGEMMSVYGDDMECMCIEWVILEWNECEGMCVFDKSMLSVI